MHCPTSDHWIAFKLIFWYLYGTSNPSLVLYHNSFLSLHAISNADWTSNKDDFNFTSSYIVYFGCNPISWSAKKQRTIARSFTEADSVILLLHLLNCIGYVHFLLNLVFIFPLYTWSTTIMLVLLISALIWSFILI